MTKLIHTNSSDILYHVTSADLEKLDFMLDYYVDLHNDNNVPTMGNYAFHWCNTTVKTQESKREHYIPFSSFYEISPGYDTPEHSSHYSFPDLIFRVLPNLIFGKTEKANQLALILFQKYYTNEKDVNLVDILYQQFVKTTNSKINENINLY